MNIEGGCRAAENFVLTARNPLGDALMRPGRVVVDVVFDQDGAQIRLAEDKDAVKEFAARCTEEAFPDRVGRRRRLHLIQMIGTSVSR